MCKKEKNYKSEIDPQFEYNIYMRDFLKDYPDMSADDARKYWMLKRETRGSKKYSKQDWELKNGLKYELFVNYREETSANRKKKRYE